MAKKGVQIWDTKLKAPAELNWSGNIRPDPNLPNRFVEGKGPYNTKVKFVEFTSFGSTILALMETPEGGRLFLSIAGVHMLIFKGTLTEFTNVRLNIRCLPGGSYSSSLRMCTPNGINSHYVLDADDVEDLANKPDWTWT